MALKISQLTPVAAGSLDGSEPVELGIAGDKSAPNGAFLPPAYISGHMMVWGGANSLTVTSGAAYIPSLGRVVRSPADVTKSGLVLTANTWYHLYRYVNAGVPDIDLSTTGPAVPYNGMARTKTGDTSKRYIGSVKTDAAGNILKFTHEAATGTVKYETDINNAALKLVASGTSATDATVDCTVCAPVTSRTLIAFAENNATGGLIYISNADVGTPANTNILAFIRASRTLFGEIVLTATQAFTYLAQSPATFSCYAVGYRYER